MVLFRVSKIITFLTLKKNLKKSLLVINFGIFLSIFAATGAIISLYVENKINSYEFELIYYSELKRDVEKSIADLPSILGQFDQFVLNEDINFEYSTFIKHSKFGNKIISRKDLYLPFLYEGDELNELSSFISTEEIDGLKTYLPVFPDDTKKKYEKLFNELYELKNIITDEDAKKYKQILFNSSYKDLAEEISNKENINLFSGKLFEQWLEMRKTIKFVKEFLNMFEEIFRVIIWDYDQYIKELNNNIIYHSNIEKNIILIAFILQLIIFVIVQSFEISSVNYEIKKIKKKVLSEKR
tara:strand:+ start:124 stop:1017 length:894 start_codon:yes stop_codon:yes gene_type:complete